ncbi:hypothetical protein BV22DRAFT_1135871 [Leucogyrophana mollusca]|uniref:Uncharacterized protein n=1 Tax=Leucogyrophana mollusca TaxID=85980 RepID=A0ACB8AWL2_9AGAM|nr:hypothetical protein BV22DRAFT_1135871 [Leucogyrophana mollusca]
MRDTTNSLTYRIKFHRSVTSPYRQIQRVELDNVPIHRQIFPLYGRLNATSFVTTVDSMDVDHVLIYKEKFPLEAIVEEYSLDNIPVVPHVDHALSNAPETGPVLNSTLESGTSAAANRETDITGPSLPRT